MIGKLLSETVIYGGTTILVRLISYALVPLHVTVFTPDSYGIVSEFYAYAVAANVIYTYGMETAFFRFASKNKEKTLHFFSSTLTSVFLSSLLFSILLILFSSNISVVLGYGEEATKYIIWFALLFAIDAIVALPFALLRLQHKAKRFALVKVSNAVLILLFNAFFLLFCRHVYEGRYLQNWKDIIAHIYYPEIGLGYAFLANLLANMMLIPLLTPVFLKWRPQLSWRNLKKLYHYGYPIMLSGLAFAINETADRVFIKYLLPDNFYADKASQWAVGVYAACYKLSIFITMAIQAFKYAAEPFFFAKANEKNAPATYALILEYFVVFCCVVIVLVVANLSILSQLFVPKDAYWVGLSIVPFLLFANMFLGIYYNLSVWYKLTDRTIYGAYISIFGALVTIVFNIWLIPKIGYHGSALATLICYASIVIMSYILGRKYYPVPYNISSAVINIFITALLVIGMFLWEPDTLMLELLFRNGLVIILLGLLYKKYKSNFTKLLKKRGG